jgi:methionyl-tRNA formyltransferase
MGTPEFSVPMLEAIYQSKYNLVGVVTVEDKPAGRGRKLSKSAVKTYAEKQNITILQPQNLKSDEFYTDLKNLNPNLIVVVAFRMLPKQVWDFPEYGTFNLHASLLPQYRGAAPINWAIINGEPKTGLTTFFIDDKIDTGKIINKTELTINHEDNLETIYNKMLPKGVELVIKTIQEIEENKVKPKKQKEETNLKRAPKLNKDNTKINWAINAENIYNLVRGLSPYPLAWTQILSGEEIIPAKISKVDYRINHHEYEVGKIIEEDKALFVAVNNGLIEILELKLSGKKLMKTKDLLNGFKLKSPSKMIW